MNTDQTIGESIVVENLNDLNRLYHKLLEPVRNVETLSARQEQLQDELSEAKSTLSSRFITPFSLALQFTVTLAIPFLIVFFLFLFFKKNPEGVRYFTLYDHWIGDATFLNWMEPILYGLEDLLGTVIGGLISMIIAFIAFIITPAFIFLLPAMFIISVIFTVISCIGARGNIKRIPQEMESLESEIKGIINRISEDITYVPPEYRFSDALDFICKAFDNEKADSLKEALLQYDDFAHKRRVENAQQEMLINQYEELRMLAYQSIQLNSIKSDISSIKSRV